MRRGSGEPRLVAYLGGCGRGIGPCESSCLDATTRQRTRAGIPVRMIDDPDLNAGWDCDMKAKLAAVRGDEILRAVASSSATGAPTNAASRRPRRASSTSSQKHDDGRKPCDDLAMTPWRAVLGILLGLRISQPRRNKREREAVDLGETVGRYVVERAGAADKQQRLMLVMTAISCVAAVAAAVAAILAVVN